MKLNTVLIVNLSILVFYMIAIMIYPMNEGSMEFVSRMLIAMSLIGLHVAVLLVMAITYFVMKRRETGKAFLLATLVVAVIGCSSCFGIGWLAS